MKTMDQGLTILRKENERLYLKRREFIFLRDPAADRMYSWNDLIRSCSDMESVRLVIRLLNASIFSSIHDRSLYFYEMNFVFWFECKSKDFTLWKR